MLQYTTTTQYTTTNDQKKRIVFTASHHTGGSSHSDDYIKGGPSFFCCLLYCVSLILGKVYWLLYLPKLVALKEQIFICNFSDKLIFASTISNSVYFSSIRHHENLQVKTCKSVLWQQLPMMRLRMNLVHMSARSVQQTP